MHHSHAKKDHAHQEHFDHRPDSITSYAVLSEGSSCSRSNRSNSSHPGITSTLADPAVSIAFTIFWNSSGDQLPLLIDPLPTPPLNISMNPAFIVVCSPLPGTDRNASRPPRQLVLDLQCKYPAVTVSTQRVDAVRRARECIPNWFKRPQLLHKFSRTLELQRSRIKVINNDVDVLMR